MARTRGKDSSSMMAVVVVVIIAAVMGGVIYMQSQKEDSGVPSRPPGAEEAWERKLDAERVPVKKIPAAAPDRAAVDPDPEVKRAVTQPVTPPVAKTETTPQQPVVQTPSSAPDTGGVTTVKGSVPEDSQTGFPKNRATGKYSWQKPQAKVDAKGRLSWAPEAFTFETGSSVRYIDYEKGSDSNNGTSKTTAWKHHPWDPKASGSAKSGGGNHTYVFKRGVVYRGELVAQHNGTKDNPLRLTSDPSWGSGEAVLAGSEIVKGWKKGADNNNIPEKGKVWYVDLDWPVRRAWMVDGGEITKLNLARTPNWKVSDPEDVLSEWWEWENPQWWKKETREIKIGGRTYSLGTDKKHLTESPDYYKDAIIWSEWAIVMGTPFSAKVEKYFPDKKALAFQGRWMGPSQINKGNRYCLEDKPHYLDEAGEFWFHKKGNGGRLYLRLPGDKNPNSTTVEVAKYYNLIQDQCSNKAPNRMDVYKGDKNALNISGLNNAVISGLTFRFTNTWWNIEFPPWMHKEVSNAAIRLLGSSDNVTVANCVFEQVNCAIRVNPQTDKVIMGKHVFKDNRIEYIDHSAIAYRDGKGSRNNRGNGGMDVQVLRNKIYMSGLRPFRQMDGHSLCVNFPDTMEVAGNILDRTYGAGIFVFGGKGGGDLRDRPFSRNLVYGNQATNTLLCANDWGGIETWQGGPFYVYNNISGNPNGLWNWSWRNGKKPGRARLGFAYYLDGGFKNYHFNNIAWGISNDLQSKHCSNTAFYHATTTVGNNFVNNTAYLFKQGSGWSPAGGRQLNLGNIFSDISALVFSHGKQKEDKDAVYKKYPFDTIAYAKNIFYKVPKKFGNLEGAGTNKYDFNSFKEAVKKSGLLSSDVGQIIDSQPLEDPAEKDFRPKAGTPAIDGGVKLFVPWALYGMVGEYNFRVNNSDPSKILDDHWYMRNYYVNRTMYKDCPVFNLRGTNVTAESFVQGALEDWTQGALKFDGESTYCSISNAELGKEFTYKYKERRQQKTGIAKGDAVGNANPGNGNLLLEVYFKTGAGHAGGVLVSKESGTGYILSIADDGCVKMTLKLNGSEACSRKSGENVNDGKWHHVIAEVDRQQAQGVVIYIDGKRSDGAFIGNMPSQGESLSNQGDLIIGKANKGGYFNGIMDFLRICKGTLADAKTDIDELYEWQFNGPFLRDFAGAPVTGEARDAGAIEMAQ